MARAYSLEDGQALVVSDASIQAVLLNWDLGADDKGSHRQAMELLEKLRERHGEVPVFLLAERATATRTITIEVAEMVDEFVWMLEDTPDFLAGRVVAAIGRYRASIAASLRESACRLRASSRALVVGARPPGRHSVHQDPAGRAFFDFYGENLFRTDMGIERGQLGSLLDHTGPVLQPASDTRLGCLAHTAATPVSSEPPDPIEPSCRPA